VPVVPPAARSGRRNHFIAPSTQSMVVALQGHVLLTADLAANSPTCTLAANRSRRCTARATAPSGDRTFKITTYDGPHGTGNVLSQGDVTATLVANHAVQLDISLNGKPAQIALSIESPYPPAGRPATTAVIVSLLDADGNTILGNYSNSVTLTDGDTSGATHLTATNLSSSSARAGLSYNGGTLASAMISANAPGVATARAVLAPSPTTIAQYLAPPLITPNGPRPVGVSDLCVGPDGNIWATGASSGAIEKVTPQGKYTTYPLIGTEPLGISVGSDGNLWFAEMQAAKIGRITTGGRISGYAIPTPAGGTLDPTWTATGPDGRTWFVAQGIKTPSIVGAIRPPGRMSIYRLPSASNPQEIVAGPDGNLWISDGGLNAILVMSTAGRLVGVHKLPTPNAAPWGITVGPDKNIWIAEFQANLIGRMTTSGALKEFPSPTPFSGPLNVTSGPDGNVWFTETGGGFWDFAGKVGYVTPNGSTIRDFPGGSLREHVHDLAFDSKGHLWYSKFAFGSSALDELVY
jgi:streptogramin lyase